MKQYCFYDEKLPFNATKEELCKILSSKQQLLDNYMEISCDLDDEMYISRGNGFCATKWSSDVIDYKIEQLTKHIEQLHCWIENSE